MSWYRFVPNLNFVIAQLLKACRELETRKKPMYLPQLNRIIGALHLAQQSADPHSINDVIHQQLEELGKFLLNTPSLLQLSPRLHFAFNEFKRMNGYVHNLIPLIALVTSVENSLVQKDEVKFVRALSMELSALPIPPPREHLAKILANFINTVKEKYPQLISKPDMVNAAAHMKALLHSLVGPTTKQLHELLNIRQQQISSAPPDRNELCEFHSRESLVASHKSLLPTESGGEVLLYINQGLFRYVGDGACAGVVFYLAACLINDIYPFGIDPNTENVEEHLCWQLRTAAIPRDALIYQEQGCVERPFEEFPLLQLSQNGFAVKLRELVPDIRKNPDYFIYLTVTPGRQSVGASSHAMGIIFKDPFYHYIDANSKWQRLNIETLKTQHIISELIKWVENVGESNPNYKYATITRLNKCSIPRAVPTLYEGFDYIAANQFRLPPAKSYGDKYFLFEEDKKNPTTCSYRSSPAFGRF